MKSRFFVRLFQIGFISCIAILLLGSLARTFLAPRSVNEYENRKANQPPTLSLSAFLSGELQEDMDNALADQVFGAQTAKRQYNTAESKLSFSVLRSIYESHPGRYFTYNQVLVFNSDYLLYTPRALTEDSRAAFDRKLQSIHSLVKNHPDPDYYVYYIEKDTDINFETGEKCGNYEYISQNLDRDLCSLDCFSIDSFEEYSEKFYHTDHHWNHKGSYEGYLQLCKLLGIDEPLPIGKEFLVGSAMKGSKLAAAKDEVSWSEPMYAYSYDYPTMEISVNGESCPDYGNQNRDASYLTDVANQLSYSHYYGYDMGEVIIDTGHEERENILLLGESFDNAILKLLASHFGRTHSVDLRYYSHYMGKDFDFGSYIRENGITKVLFIGNIDYFVLDEFNVGG